MHWYAPVLCACRSTPRLLRIPGYPHRGGDAQCGEARISALVLYKIRQSVRTAACCFFFLSQSPIPIHSWLGSPFRLLFSVIITSLSIAIITAHPSSHFGRTLLHDIIVNQKPWPKKTQTPQHLTSYRRRRPLMNINSLVCQLTCFNFESQDVSIVSMTEKLRLRIADLCPSL